MERRPNSNVSVDVLTLRYNATDREVELAVYPRATEPYIGQLALPGITLLEGERLADAAQRAVHEKLGVGVRGLGPLTVFDEPSRDPRGFTLSVAMWAVADGAEPHADVSWYPLDDVPALAFDHNQMVTSTRQMLTDKLWRDLAFTRALRMILAVSGLSSGLGSVSARNCPRAARRDAIAPCVVKVSNASAGESRRFSGST